MERLELKDNKVCVIIENKFIPEEIEAYKNCFSLIGVQVDLISRIWYGEYKPESVTFYSDVDPLDNNPLQCPQTLTVYKDVSAVKVTDYSAIIMSANYTSIRLRWNDLSLNNIPANFDIVQYLQNAPLVKFYAEAMKYPNIIKGALCHGLWILTPYPNLLKNRNVICHPVVMSDIVNCGAKITLDPLGVVVDNDLVTGYSKHEVIPFIKKIIEKL